MYQSQYEQANKIRNNPKEFQYKKINKANKRELSYKTRNKLQGQDWKKKTDLENRILQFGAKKSK